jgi:hypothetical protein
VVSGLFELWIRSQSAGFRSEFTAALRLASVENKNSTAQFCCFIGRGSCAGSSKLFVFLETLEELAGLHVTKGNFGTSCFGLHVVSVLVGIDRELEFLF